MNHNYLIVDPCSSMRCHINAKCSDGECRCLDGYQGDGKHYCDPIQQGRSMQIIHSHVLLHAEW